MGRAVKGDQILVDGDRVSVTDHAEFDNLLRIEYPNGDSTIIMQSQVEWNFTETAFVKQDAELTIDFTFLP